MEEVLGMSKKEIERMKVLSLLEEGQISQIVASKRLKISDRQVRNLMRRIKEEGIEGLISKKRGRIKNHKIKRERKEEILSIISRYYSDFGPTLTSEYLREEHGIKISKETTRKWMIEKGMWEEKKKRKNYHPVRKRREFFGELIQVDGSHHDWLEGRGDKCVLMVFIDDATSYITSLYFTKTESLEGYYRSLKKHVEKYGIPLGIYGDRCATLCARKQENETQFQRALEELGAELILARSPQAKGRVERVNRTLQDRLVKYLRMKGIKTIEEANEVIEEYRREHNKKFSKKPMNKRNAHRPLEGIDIDKILCNFSTRTLSKDLVVQYQNNFYEISGQEEKIKTKKKAKIEIRKKLDGTIEAYFKGERVEMKLLREVSAPVLDEKEIMIWEPKERHKPLNTHPWKAIYYKKMQSLRKNTGVM